MKLPRNRIRHKRIMGLCNIAAFVGVLLCSSVSFAAPSYTRSNRPYIRTNNWLNPPLKETYLQSKLRNLVPSPNYTTLRCRYTDEFRTGSTTPVEFRLRGRLWRLPFMGQLGLRVRSWQTTGLFTMSCNFGDNWPNFGCVEPFTFISGNAADALQKAKDAAPNCFRRLLDTRRNVINRERRYVEDWRIIVKMIQAYRGFPNKARADGFEYRFTGSSPTLAEVIATRMVLRGASRARLRRVMNGRIVDDIIVRAYRRALARLPRRVLADGKSVVLAGRHYRWAPPNRRGIVPLNRTSFGTDGRLWVVMSTHMESFRTYAKRRFERFMRTGRVGCEEAQAALVGAYGRMNASEIAKVMAESPLCDLLPRGRGSLAAVRPWLTTKRIGRGERMKYATKAGWCHLGEGRVVGFHNLRGANRARARGLDVITPRFVRLYIHLLEAQTKRFAAQYKKTIKPKDMKFANAEIKYFEFIHSLITHFPALRSLRRSSSALRSSQRRAQEFQKAMEQVMARLQAVWEYEITATKFNNVLKERQKFQEFQKVRSQLMARLRAQPPHNITRKQFDKLMKKRIDKLMFDPDSNLSKFRYLHSWLMVAALEVRASPFRQGTSFAPFNHSLLVVPRGQFKKKIEPLLKINSQCGVLRWMRVYLRLLEAFLSAIPPSDPSILFCSPPRLRTDGLPRLLLDNVIGAYFEAFPSRRQDVFSTVKSFDLRGKLERLLQVARRRPTNANYYKNLRAEIRKINRFITGVTNEVVQASEKDCKSKTLEFRHEPIEKRNMSLGARVTILHVNTTLGGPFSHIQLKTGGPPGRSGQTEDICGKKTDWWDWVFKRRVINCPVGVISKRVPETREGAKLIANHVFLRKPQKLSVGRYGSYTSKRLATRAGGVRDGLVLLKLSPIPAHATLKLQLASGKVVQINMRTRELKQPHERTPHVVWEIKPVSPKVIAIRGLLGRRTRLTVTVPDWKNPVTTNVVFRFPARTYDVSGSKKEGERPPRPPKPSIIKLTPNRVPQASTDMIIVEGTNFAKGAQVQVGTRLLPTTTVSSTKLTFTLPTNFQAGTYNVRVLNPDNQSSNTVQLTVFHPSILSPTRDPSVVSNPLSPWILAGYIVGGSLVLGGGIITGVGVNEKDDTMAAVGGVILGVGVLAVTITGISHGLRKKRPAPKATTSGARGTQPFSLQGPKTVSPKAGEATFFILR